MPGSSALSVFRSWKTALVGCPVLIGSALGLRRLRGDRTAARIAYDLFAHSTGGPATFSPDLVADLPELARRYLRHAIAPGTPLAPAVRLRMDGSMTPTPGGARIHLSAEETLAPLRGFVWTAHATLAGLPVRVRDYYFAEEGGVRVDLLGLVPLPFSGSRDDVTRSSRGRLIAEAVWCPAVLVAPDVRWEAVDADRVRFTSVVDGEAVPVTIHVGPDGALREVTLQRWGDAGVASPRFLPYGFAVEEERTFDGITIPTYLRGGWEYGTERYDPGAASSFAIRSATFASLL